MVQEHELPPELYIANPRFVSLYKPDLEIWKGSAGEGGVCVCVYAFWWYGSLEGGGYLRGGKVSWSDKDKRLKARRVKRRND
jgi:hypothetical protein